ncbi:MAG: XrtA/PEP-CTERM system amidotransferase [Cellvibrionaceae bacterium]
MCGIVGLFDPSGNSEISRDLLEAMNQRQVHRGPDGGNLHIEQGLGFGHRRLSIIDISSGHQPLFNEDDTVVVTYNGEIYNFIELMDELIKLGHSFKTRCDTEVIVHAWEQWGEDCVQRFRGMFAFAIWDRNSQTLFMARDRLGIKPLFYTLLPNGFFAFSSELKALKAIPDLPRRLDPTAIDDYFSLGYIPEPKTIYSNVCKLEPAQSLLFERGRDNYVLSTYWRLNPAVPVETDERTAAQELTERIREAVDLRMVSEVPLGAFLSGGVDSGAVVSQMAGLSQAPVNTCSIGFDVDRFDETQYAKMVSDRYQTNHFEGRVAPDDFSLIDLLPSLYDEPYADSSAIPTYRVCELAKQRVTVALSGDGGDEHLAGYRRYCWHMNEERVRAAMPLEFRRRVFGPLGKLYPKADWAPRVFRAKTTFESLARSSVEAYFHSVSLSTQAQRDELFSAALNRDLQGYRAVESFDRHAQQAPTDDPLGLIQYLDIKTYLVGDILTKVDRASMHHSLEVRVPLLDHKLVEWIWQLPASLKLNGQMGKYVFKKAMEPYLPNDILYRRKMGFGVPLADWFRGPLQGMLKQRLLGGVIAESGLFNLGFIEQVIDQHLAKTRDNSVLIWTLFMFQGFLQQEFDEFRDPTTHSASAMVSA